MTIPLVNGVNPLQTTLLQLGIVSGRVALLLRSTEIHPVLLRFVKDPFTGIRPSSLLPGKSSREGVQKACKGRRRCTSVALLEPFYDLCTIGMEGIHEGRQ